MHKSIIEAFTNEGSVRSISEDVVKGLSIDSTKPLNEAAKKAISKVLSAVDSGVPLSEAIDKAMVEARAQSSGGAIAVSNASSIGFVVETAQRAYESLDPALMNRAKEGFQSRAQDAILEAVEETIIVYPEEIGHQVTMGLINSMNEPAFIQSTNERIDKLLKRVGK
jgi:hypothetical protein